jgi:hypothetical protein
MAWLVVGVALLFAAYVAIDLLGRRWRRTSAGS